MSAGFLLPTRIYCAPVVEMARPGDDTRATAAAGLATVIAAMAYVVGAVNIELLTAADAPSVERRRQMLRNWHRGNAVRLAAIAATAAALARPGRS